MEDLQYKIQNLQIIQNRHQLDTENDSQYQYDLKQNEKNKHYYLFQSAQIQEQFNTFSDEIDLPVSNTKYLQELDQWKYDLKYKNQRDQNIQEVKKKYNKSIQDHQNTGPIINAKLVNSIVNGTNLKNNPFQKQPKNQHKKTNSETTFLNTKTTFISQNLDSTSTTNLNNTQNNNQNSVLLQQQKQQNKHLKTNNFLSNSYILNSSTLNSNQLNSTQTISSQQENNNKNSDQKQTQAFQHRSINKDLINNMLIDRMKRKIKTQKKLTKSYNNTTTSNNNMHNNVTMDTTTINPKKQQDAEVAEMFRNESKHFQEDILNSFQGLFKHFTKPNQAVDTKQVVKNIKNIYKGPTGLQKLHYDSQEEEKLKQVRQKDQDSYFKYMEKNLLEQFCNISIKLKELQEKISNQKQKNIKIGHQIQSLNNEISHCQDNAQHEIQKIQKEKQKQKELKLRLSNIHSMNQIQEIEKIEQKWLQRQQVLKEQLQFQLTEQEHNEHQIDQVQNEYQEAKDNKNQTRVSLNELYLEMLRSSKYTQESLVWIIKALMRIEQDVDTTNIYPNYLDQTSRLFLKNYAEQELMMEELKDQQQMKSKECKHLKLDFEQTVNESFKQAQNTLTHLSKHKSMIISKPVYNLQNQKGEQFVQLQTMQTDQNQNAQKIETQKYQINSDQQSYYLHQQILRDKILQVQKQLTSLQNQELNRLFQKYLPTKNIYRVQELQFILKDLYGLHQGEHFYKIYLRKRVEFNELIEKNKTYLFSDKNNIKKMKINLEHKLLEQLDQEEFNTFGNYKFYQKQLKHQQKNQQNLEKSNTQESSFFQDLPTQPSDLHQSTSDYNQNPREKPIVGLQTHRKTLNSLKKNLLQQAQQKNQATLQSSQYFDNQDKIQQKFMESFLKSSQKNQSQQRPLLDKNFLHSSFQRSHSNNNTKNKLFYTTLSSSQNTSFQINNNNNNNINKNNNNNLIRQHQSPFRKLIQKRN